MWDNQTRPRYRVSKRHHGSEQRKTDPIQITHLDGQPLSRGQRRTGLRGILDRLPRMEDPAQKRAGRNLTMFLAMILILTFIARGTAAATLALVTTVSPSANEVMRSLRSTGSVRAGDNLELIPPSSLKVEKVLGSPGQQIAEGDPLLAFRQEDVEEEFARAEVKLKEARVKLEKLQQVTPNGDTTLSDAQKKYGWAQEDYLDAKKEADISITKAQKGLDTANAALKSLQDQKESLEKEARLAEQSSSQNSESSLNTEISEVSEPKGEGKSIQERIQEVQGEISSAQEQVNSAKEALTMAHNEKDSKLKQSNRDVETAKDAITQAEESQSKDQIEKSNAKKENEVEAETLKLDIKVQEKIIEKLQKLKDDEGIFKATKAGSIKTLPDVGASENVSVVLVDTSGGYEVDISISKDDAKSLLIGMEVDVVDTSGSAYGNQGYKASIKKISEPDSEKMVQIVIALPQGKWEQGSSLEIRIVKDKLKHSTCVPLSAIRSNSVGKYILVTEQRTTVLGTESVLVEIPITVLLTGDDSVAINGAFSPNDKIVQESTKPVEAGDRVRVNVS